MGILQIEESKALKKEFDRLGRAGISERAIYLINEYIAENPDHNYKEITKLIGRFHALYIAIDNSDYWKEIADRGYRPELNQLPKYRPSVAESQN